MQAIGLLKAFQVRLLLSSRRKDEAASQQTYSTLLPPKLRTRRLTPAS